jgi:glycogen debranching enzyme
MAERNSWESNLVKIRPRATTVQLSRGRTAFVTGLDGMARPERPIEGLFIYDTQILSPYAWRMNGKQPAYSCGSNVEQDTWTGYYIQAPENCKKTPTGECNPLEETLELRLSRSVGEGMHEDVRLTNHTQISTRVKLELDFEIQFRALEEAQSGRKQRGRLEMERTQPEKDVWELRADYRAEHRYSHQGDKGVAKLHRGMILRIEHADSKPDISKGSITFSIKLRPHQQWHACLSWMGSIEGKLLPLAAQCSHVDSGDWDARRTRFFAESASFSAPHSDDLSHLVYRVMQRSRLDLGALRMYDLDSPGGEAVAAGVPTYMEVFGRDLEASSWQAAMLTPQLLRGTLNVLRQIPATRVDDWRDAQPGRIPHELHTDPLSVLNFKPKSLYFGSATASYLLPVCVSEMWHWTGDLNSIRTYVDAAMHALEWADKYSLDKTGFYRYRTRSEQGVKNQGWKDSGDAIVYEDGSQVKDPLGTCEMQAFMYAAKLQFSEVMWRMGDVQVARRLYREAEDLKKRFNDKFWMEKEGYFAMGIDPRGKPIRSIASDPGHCLLSGIVDKDRVKRVAERMMRDDLFSGWGVRTLSAEHPAFNPFSYHRGSVWPVTNASFVLAFARYGLHGEMHRLARAFFEAASLFENDRLPEVFGGHARTPDAPFPGLYTQADWPQAWSASAPFTVMQALLGIYPYAPASLVFLDPRLPDWLPDVTVRRLQIGSATATIRFFRTADGSTEYEILDQEGTLHVIRQPSPWSVTTGWAERIRDAVESLLPHRKAS